MAQGPPAGIPDRRKRREKRHLAFGVNAKAGRLETNVTNASLSGIGLESHEPLRVGKTITLTVRSRESSVDVTGSVRWCKMDMSKGASGEPITLYGAGVKLDELSAERIQRLEQVTHLPISAPVPAEKGEEEKLPEPQGGFPPKPG